jgi:hypothetical protein
MMTLETYFLVGRETKDGRVELISGSLTNVRDVAEEKCFFLERKDGTKGVWKVFRVNNVNQVKQ